MLDPRHMLALAVFFVAVSLPVECWAHTPHDEVSAIRLSGLIGERFQIFAIIRDNLWLSSDGAASWRRLARGLPHARLRDFVTSGCFERSGRAALASDVGLRFSDDGGESWRLPAGDLGSERFQEVPELLPGLRPHVRLAADREGPLMACLVDTHALVSRDGGATWRAAPGHVPARPTSALVLDGRIWWGGADGRVVPEQGRGAHARVGAPVAALAAHDPGSVIFVGTDGGGVWRVEPDGGAERVGLDGQRVTSLVAIPVAAPVPLLVAALWRDGVYRSEDGGRTWRPGRRGLTQDPQADLPAFLVPQFKQLAAGRSAEGKHVLYLAGFDGLFRSEDLGASWSELPTAASTRLIVGLSATAEPEGVRLAVSHYGAGVVKVPVPERGDCETWRALNGRRTFAVARVHTSEDRIETWAALHDAVYAIDELGRTVRVTPLMREMQDRPSLGPTVRRLAVRPVKALLAALPPQARTVARNALVPRASALGMHIGVRAFGSVFAVSPRFSRDGIAFVSTWLDGLFRTADGGRRFRRIAAPEGPIYDLSIFAQFRRGWNAGGGCWKRGRRVHGRRCELGGVSGARVARAGTPRAAGGGIGS